MYKKIPRLLYMLNLLSWNFACHALPQELKNINYVKLKYEKNLFNLDHLVYPASNPNKIYIIFNSAVKDRYSMWSWFWNTNESWDETLFLFLKDDSFSWYLGSHEHPLLDDYINLIEFYLDKYNLKNNQIYTIGGSMGGYAAIIYGIILEASGIYAYNPQIDYESAALRFKVGGLESLWIEPERLLNNRQGYTNIFLYFGDFYADKRAAEKFIEMLQRKPGKLVIQKSLHPGHKGLPLSVDSIMATLTYFEKA